MLLAVNALELRVFCTRTRVPATLGTTAYQVHTTHIAECDSPLAAPHFAIALAELLTETRAEKSIRLRVSENPRAAYPVVCEV